MRIKKDVLLKGLSIADKICGKGSSHLPILACVLIDGPGQKLIATDLEMGMEFPIEIADWEKTVPADPEQTALMEARKNPEPDLFEGLKKPQLMNLADDYNFEIPSKGTVPAIRKAMMETVQAAADVETEVAETVEIQECFCLNAKNLMQLVKSLEEDEVEITLSEAKDGLFDAPYVRVGSHFQNLPTFASDEFPSFEIERGENITTVSKENLKAVLVATAKAAEDGFRLSNVLFEEGRAVATDGHRLHKVPANVQEKWMLPASAGKIIAVLGDEEIQFAVGAKAVVDVKGATIAIRPGDSMFPDYQAVIPESQEHNITVKKSDMKRAIDQAMLITDGDHCSARVTFNGGIDVEAMNPNRGNYQRSEIPAQGTVEPSVTMGLNLKYLADAMNFLDDKKDISLSLKDHVNPLCIHQGDFFGLIMPMRVE